MTTTPLHWEPPPSSSGGRARSGKVVWTPGSSCRREESIAHHLALASYYFYVFLFCSGSRGPGLGGGLWRRPPGGGLRGLPHRRLDPPRLRRRRRRRGAAARSPPLPGAPPVWPHGRRDRAEAELGRHHARLLQLRRHGQAVERQDGTGGKDGICQYFADAAF